MMTKRSLQRIYYMTLQKAERKAKSRKWVMVVLAYLLDTIRVNSATLYALNNKKDPTKQNSVKHGYYIAEQLVLLHIQQRNRVDLNSIVMR